VRPAAGDRWLLPDGVTETEDDEAYLVVMNPFAREAVFSVTLLGRREPVQHSSTTDVALKPFRKHRVPASGRSCPASRRSRRSSTSRSGASRRHRSASRCPAASVPRSDT
jgi:hypothetical protein